MAIFQEAAGAIQNFIREHGADNAFSIQEIADEAKRIQRRATRLAVGRACSKQLKDIEGHLRRLTARSFKRTYRSCLYSCH